MSTTYTRQMPRYRARTWLRGHAPSPLIGLFPKGTDDCGDHEWYRADETTDRCYHCTVGVRHHEPAPAIVEGATMHKITRSGSPSRTA